MADGINQVTLSGHLGADAKLVTFENGDAIANLRVATTSSYTDRKTNERKEVTDWHSVVLSGGKRAVGLAPHLTKGKQITLTGQLKTRSYEKDGVKQYATEIRANTIVLGGSGGARAENPPGDAREPADGGDAAFNADEFGV